jgi:hypothetical protein
MNQVNVLMDVYLIPRRRRFHGPLVSLSHRPRAKDRDLLDGVPRRNLERVDVSKADAILCFVVNACDEGNGGRVE